jgi:pilus assembly protein CpaB
VKIREMAKANKGVLLLFVAAGFGVLSVFAARNYLGNQLALEKAKLQPKQALAEVIVAKADLPRGSFVDKNTMAVRQVPKDFLVSGSVTPERFESYIGSKVAYAMRAGEPLILQSLEGADATTFSAKVKTGIRAMTIAVDEVNSVSGMLQPGDRVDLLFSVKPPVVAAVPSQPSEMTGTLMQDVPILATGKQVRPGQGENQQSRTFTTITIEVTPQAAQRLVVAQRSGKLTALLRNPSDHAPLTQPALDIYGLLQIPPPKAMTAQASTAPEMIIGGKGQIAPLASKETK